MVTRLFLIRHGITEWNQEGRYCGCKDVALSSQGKLQAKRLAKRLKDAGFDKIYSSDRRRALQTARIVFKQARIIKKSALREINFGAIEGLRHREIMEKYGVVYSKWLDDPYQNCLPGAESISVFKKRVNSAIRKIAGDNRGKNAAIVCHGGVIAIFVSSLLKSRNFWKYVPAATSVTLVESRKGKFKVKWVK